MLDMRDTERKLYKSATHLGYSKIAYFDTLNQLKGKRKRGMTKREFREKLLKELRKRD